VAEDNKKEDFTPPKRTFTAEFFVGIFAIIGLAAFGYLAVNIAQIKLVGSDSYPIQAEFDNVSGLEVGARVEIAGVPVGNVTEIKLDKTSALITMNIDRGTIIRDDDIASIRTKGIIGERFIKISPGSSEDLVEAGGNLFDTESAVEFEDIIGKFIHRMDSGSDKSE
jgi:phospholipid/cholesterol/gamma-HCH transport system substrate-binding protein